METEAIDNQANLVNYDIENENEIDDLGYQSEEYIEDAHEDDENNHSNGYAKMHFDFSDGGMEHKAITLLLSQYIEFIDTKAIVGNAMIHPKDLSTQSDKAYIQLPYWLSQRFSAL
ncbi:hypothetical protein Tco_0998860 [Tanacetum coccineum]